MLLSTVKTALEVFCQSEKILAYLYITPARAVAKTAQKQILFKTLQFLKNGLLKIFFADL